MYTYIRVQYISIHVCMIYVIVCLCILLAYMDELGQNTHGLLFDGWITVWARVFSGF